MHDYVVAGACVRSWKSCGRQGRQVAVWSNFYSAGGMACKAPVARRVDMYANAQTPLNLHITFIGNI